MKTITLPGGILLNEIALGAGKLGDSRFEDECFAVMDRYAERGGTTFDTARIYAGGACDKALGRWLSSRHMRDKATVITKGSHPDKASMLVSRLSPEEIEFDLDQSLLALGIEYADIHILHRDDVKKPVGEIMDTLNRLIQKGKTRAIGVSNWTATRIMQANAYADAHKLSALVCAQAHYSLAQTTAQTVGDLTYVPMNDVELSWYRESGFPLIAFGAQARGWFAARAAGLEPKESPRRHYDGWPENHRRLERLLCLSRKLNHSMAAVALAYVRDSMRQVVPLCAFSGAAQLDDSFDALSFTLAPEDVAYLEGRQAPSRII